jgi:hypothetical protein
MKKLLEKRDLNLLKLATKFNCFFRFEYFVSFLKSSFLAVFVLFFLFSCEEVVKPKPKAYLALEYPEAEYDKVSSNCPYTFQVNRNSLVKPARSGNPCWIDI